MKFFAVNKADKNKAEILVYGYIGGGDEGVTSGDFIRELKNLEKTFSKIEIRINTGGGSVFEGFAIFNALLNCKAETVGYIDGICASIGTVIALGCDKIYMSKIARFMTHSASAGCAGNANEMRQTAQLLESLDATMCGIYAKRTGKTADQCKKDYLDKGDRWFSAEQAVAEKLVDGIYDADPINVPIKATAEQEVWSIYNEHRFAAIFTQNLNQNTMKIELTAAAKAALNIGDNADQSAIDTAINALVAKANKADQLQAQLTTATTEKEAAETKLAEALKASNKEKVDAILNQALNVDKKITAAAKVEFETSFGNNPDGLKKIIDALPAHSSITSQLDSSKEAKGKFEGDWDALDKAGKLDALKAENIELFKEKFKAKWNKEYAA
jgi:ATP-dependent protease ClpP protease subunit